MNCPSCGKRCVRPAEEILDTLNSIYISCPNCPSEPNLDKDAPLQSLPSGQERCGSCGKATLDAVMLDALHVLVSMGLRDKEDTLRSIGSPLIAIGYPLAFPPRLGPGSLVIVGENLSQQGGQAILRQVAEIKGVIRGGGVPGIFDSRSKAHEWALLAGCDMRGDVIQSLFGELVIYKSQSKIHIEFPRQSAPKLQILEDLYLKGSITEVVDGLCGPGTLGLMCALAGAKHVILNDIWLPAVENALINLEANRNLLGIKKIERMEQPTALVGSDPVLLGRADGACRIEVYHGDLKKLFSRASSLDLCLIDPFPGSDMRDLKKACSSCGEVILI